MLSDDWGRDFHYLRLSLTEQCNFKCNYCLPDGNDCKHEDPLSSAEISTLVKAFAQLGTTKVRLTGGEPALRSDLIDIIKLVKATPGIEQVALTTNGYKLERDAHKYAEAGLDKLNVSIDSFNPEHFKLITGADKLNSIMRGIDNAEAAGIRSIKINSVLMKGFNLDQFNQGLNFVKHHSIDLRFIELMQTGSNQAFYKAHHISGATLESQLKNRGWSTVTRSITDGPSITYSHPNYKGRIGLIMPYRKDFCATCNRLRVSSEGNLHLCLFAEKGISIRAPLKDQNVDLTAELIQQLVRQKGATHHLNDGKTGATRHLAMLGG